MKATYCRVKTGTEGGCVGHSAGSKCTYSLIPQQRLGAGSESSTHKFVLKQQ